MSPIDLQEGGEIVGSQPVPSSLPEPPPDTTGYFSQAYHSLDTATDRLAQWLGFDTVPQFAEEKYGLDPLGMATMTGPVGEGGTIEAMKRLAKDPRVIKKLGLKPTNEEELFFGNIYPRLAKLTGMTVSPEQYDKAAELGVSDIEGFVKKNPHFTNYYGVDLEAAGESIGNHIGKLSNDEFSLFRFLNGLFSTSTPLEQNTFESYEALKAYRMQGNLRGYGTYERPIDIHAKPGEPAPPKAAWGKLPGTEDKGWVHPHDWVQKIGDREVAHKAGDPWQLVRASKDLPMPVTLAGGAPPTKAEAMRVFSDLVDRMGITGAINYLKEEVPVSELKAFNKSAGYKGDPSNLGAIKSVVKFATGQDEKIPRIFIFGKKVGAYTLNNMGDYRYNTSDVWDSRHMKTYFTDLLKGRTGIHGSLNEHELHDKFVNSFIEKYRERIDPHADAASIQAGRWFYILDAASEMGYTRALTRKKISQYVNDIIEAEKAQAEGIRKTTTDPADWRGGPEGGSGFFATPEARQQRGYREGGAVDFQEGGEVPDRIGSFLNEPAPVDQQLVDFRKNYLHELGNPNVVSALYSLTHNEVGKQGPYAQQAFMETVFNRAGARNNTLAQAISDTQYYPAASFGPAELGPEDLENYNLLLSNVLSGSNLTQWGTGNASGRVGFNGGPQTYAAGGERFGIEGPDMGWEVRRQIEAMPQRGLIAGNVTRASVNDFLNQPDDIQKHLGEDTTQQAIVHGLAHGGVGVVAGWGLAALGDATGFNEAISAMTGPAAPITFGGLNILEFLGGSLLGEKGIDTAEKALAKYVPAIEDMRKAAADHPVANQISASIPMLPFAWRSAKGYYDIAKAAQSVPEAATIIAGRVGGGAAVGAGMEAIRPHLEAAFNNIGLKLGFTPDEIQQPTTRSFLENAAIGAALNGMFGSRLMRNIPVQPNMTGGVRAAQASGAAAPHTQTPKRPKQSAQQEDLNGLSNSMAGVTKATVVPNVPGAPTKGPAIGMFGAGKRLVASTFERWLKNWDRARQNALGYSGFVGKRLLNMVPRGDRRVAIYNWAAAGGDENLIRQWIAAAPGDVKKGYEDALTLTDFEKSVGERVRDGFDEWLQRAKDMGMLQEGVDNYLKRIVIKRPEIADETLHNQFGHSGNLRTSFQESRHRFWQEMVDAENEGVRYDKDIAKSVYAYARSFSDASVDRAALKQLFDLETENGRPMFVVSGSGQLVNPGEENQALLVTPYGVRRIRGQAAEAARLKQLHPNWSDDRADAVARDRILNEYVPMPEARALKGWQWVNKLEDGTTALVRGDVLVHKSVADVVRNKFAPPRTPWLDTALRGIGFIKGSKLSLTLFHGVHERVNAAGHLINSFNLRPLEQLMSLPEIQRGMYGGLQIASHAQDSALFNEGMAAHGWPELIPGLGKYIKAYKDNMFEDRIPRMKAEMYLQALKRNRARYPKLNEEQLATLTARESNATFGEQNYRQMVGKLTSDPTFWKWMRAFFLAPDFGISKLQHISQALTPYGGEQRMGIGVVAAGLYTGARFLNYLLSEDNNPHWEPEHAFSVIVGDRQFSLRSLPGDMQHLFSNPASYVIHRLSPGVNSTMELLTKRDFMGRPIGWSDVVKDTLMQGVPIPLETAIEGAGAAMGLQIGSKTIRYDMRDLLGNAIGFSSAFYREETELKKWITNWKSGSSDPKLQAEVERAQGTSFPSSQYHDLRDALGNDDFATAEAAYDDLVRKQGGGYKAVQNIRNQMRRWQDAPLTGSKKNEGAFKKSLSEEQLKVYNRVRSERKKVYQNFVRMKKTFVGGTPLLSPKNPIADFLGE